MHATYPYLEWSRKLNPAEYIEAVQWCMDHNLLTAAVAKSGGSQKLVRIGNFWTTRLYNAVNYGAVERCRKNPDAFRLMTQAPMLVRREFYFRDVADATLFRMRYS